MKTGWLALFALIAFLAFGVEAVLLGTHHHTRVTPTTKTTR